MTVEIERKFLLSRTPLLKNGVEMVQGYLCTDVDRTVRVRREGGRATLTIKGKSVGISRSEFEYEIPLDEAMELMSLAVGSLVEKVRYYYQIFGHTWEIDVFKGDNTGLVVAEIELSSEDEEFEKPDWLGQEVSEDRRYSNSTLSHKPYHSW